MKKILIMIMSCNKKHFIEQEHICENTYLSNLPDNIDYIIYRGDYNSNEIVGNVLQLNCSDLLNYTYRKTYLALNIINSKFDYDYILRTNTSTYINIELLNAFVQSLDNDIDVWGSELILDKSENNVDCMYLRGNALLLSKKNVKLIIDKGLPLYYINDKIIDDWGIGTIFATKSSIINKTILKSFTECWYKSILNPYSNHQISDMNNTNKSFELLKNVIVIQIRNWYDRTLENKHFNEIHEVFIKNKYDDISKSIDFIYDYSTHPDLFLGHTNGFIQIKLENDVYKNGTP